MDRGKLFRVVERMDGDVGNAGVEPRTYHWRAELTGGPPGGVRSRLLSHSFRVGPCEGDVWGRSGGLRVTVCCGLLAVLIASGLLAVLTASGLFVCLFVCLLHQRGRWWVLCACGCAHAALLSCRSFTSPP